MKDWYKVENLQIDQQFRKEQYEKGERNNSSDYDSYRMLNEGLDDSNIISHNAIGNSAKNLAKVIKNIVAKSSISNTQKLKIADFGGGGRLYCACTFKGNRE